MKHNHTPNLDRLSVLVATILLAYALARFIDLPSRVFSLQLPGLYLEFVINIRTIVAFIVAGLTATGSDWLLKQHPLAENHPTFEHWLLPSLASLVIGIPLFELQPSALWWWGFAISGIFLIFVITAEYITIDPKDIRQPLAAAGLTALSFALVLSLAISLRTVGFRLIFTLPALTFGVFLVSLRTIHLRLHGLWAYRQSIIIALICAQIVAAFHYIPVSPVSFGLLFLGPAYSLTSLVANLAEQKKLTQAIIEPSIVLMIVLGASFWVK